MSFFSPSHSQQEERDRILATKRPVKKKGQSPANALTDAVINYVKLNGGRAYRINNTGIYDPTLKKFRTSGTLKGIPDVIGVWQGLFISFEIKIGADRQSEHQKLRQQEIEACGGLYVIAKEFDQFKKIYDEFRATKVSQR